MAVQINKLFDQIHNVPQVPEVVRTLITQLNDPNINFDAIAKNVEKEQVISLKVLRLVNSAHFGLAKKIGSIEEAVVMLGISKLKTLVIASGIVSSVPDLPGFDIKQFWSNSFRIATYAKWIAEQAKLENSDVVFTAGLISGLGNILIRLGDPKSAQLITEKVSAGANLLDVERKVLGYTNLEVCAELCRRWKFSDELIETIQNAGEPLSAEEPLPSSCAVKIASYVCDVFNNQINEDEINGLFPTDEWTHLGLNEKEIAGKIEELIAMESGLDGIVD